jgi:acyl dehydratase
MASTDRYFDDFEVGERFVSPGITLTEGMILDFALLYDPQPFHIDVEAAKASPYGGVISSGFQTLALGFRAFTMTGVIAKCSLGSPGLDELRWLKPVRPGDTLRSLWIVAEKRPSKSKPDRGILVSDWRILNQRDEEVMTLKGMHILAGRPAG